MKTVRLSDKDIALLSEALQIYAERHQDKLDIYDDYTAEERQQIADDIKEAEAKAEEMQGWLKREMFTVEILGDEAENHPPTIEEASSYEEAVVKWLYDMEENGTNAPHICVYGGDAEFNICRQSDGEEKEVMVTGGLFMEYTIQ